MTKAPQTNAAMRGMTRMKLSGFSSGIESFVHSVSIKLAAVFALFKKKMNGQPENRKKADNGKGPKKNRHKSSLLALGTLVALCALVNPAEAYKFASGSYTGNATTDRTIDISDTSGEADFQPDAVFAKCDTASSMVWRSAAMDAGESFTFTASASISEGIKSLAANGFVVGNASQANASGQTCYYVALANDASNDLAVGSYAGNNTDDTDIDISSTSSTPDFQPEFVLIKRDNSTGALPIWRTSAMAGDLSCHIGTSTACAANFIQALNATGFQVGNSNETNVSANYFYLAIKAVSGTTLAETYTGDGSDGRQITTVGFQPEWLFIKRDGANTMILRFRDHSGDNSFSIAGSNTGNLIQSFLSNGFELGSNASINADTNTYYYYAIKEAAAGGGGAAPQVMTIVVD